MSDTVQTLKVALEEVSKLARILKEERDEAREALRTLAEHGENEIQKLIKERDEAREIAAVFKEYAQLLGDEINEMAVFASVHGWKSSRIEQGKVLREKIKQIGEALN